MVEDTTKMVGGRSRGTFVKGLSEHAVTNASDVLRLITRAQDAEYAACYGACNCFSFFCFCFSFSFAM